MLTCQVSAFIHEKVPVRGYKPFQLELADRVAYDPFQQFVVF